MVRVGWRRPDADGRRGASHGGRAAHVRQRSGGHNFTREQPARLRRAWHGCDHHRKKRMGDAASLLGGLRDPNCSSILSQCAISPEPPPQRTPSDSPSNQPHLGLSVIRDDHRGEMLAAEVDLHARGSACNPDVLDRRLLDERPNAIEGCCWRWAAEGAVDLACMQRASSEGCIADRPTKFQRRPDV